MATALKNLSEYDKDNIPDGADYKIGIVVSEWNHNITGNLLKGAEEALLENGVLANNILVKYIPGTFELPTAAQFMANYTEVDGIITIGSVIQGETKHFDFVCEAAAQGVKDVALKHNLPVIFCVLTDNNLQQAIDRSGGKHGNKGVEAAVACLKMIELQESLNQ
ncbi:6,7-dimethyl-8-ribityllumazine synthase [Putridiphycobacter roseus]|uniref:6,7-dimethyl-8-ribityllumazine synthase n=1 Tax=Putridiphycobacter roseus TaxID=2219161 RepID=A0A2W1NQQ6_9FLAO|nr:6,7-dimethyl-8-ribityllumazine synthase [Putridiphycobacter roseus]PZE17982.1 6,7-dimethyl-8-ribityllumazine synthase [Putridiphycobacter roseus]